MISILRKLTLIALLLVPVLPINAQDDDVPETHPLLDLLSNVPDIETVRSEVYYADIRMSAATVIGDTQISLPDAWEGVGYPDEVWLGWIPIALPPFRSYLFIMIDDDGQSSGLDPTTIERTVYYGQPPSDGMILQGDFDNESIIDAFVPDTHNLHTRDDMTLLCSTTGCDDGLAIYIDERNVANPFGGGFGRREPIVLLDGLILNSADIETVDVMLLTRDGRFPSLAESSDVQAVVLVAAEQGLIRQAALFTSESGAFGDVESLMGMSERVTEENRPLIEAMVSALPAYQFIMMADTADLEAGTQAAHVLIVYDTEADAQAAIEAIEANLQPDGFVSFRYRQPFYDVLTERGEMGFQVVAHEATGRYVALFSLHGPLVQLPEPDESPSPSAGIQFDLFFDSVVARDTLWLAHENEGD